MLAAFRIGFLIGFFISGLAFASTPLVPTNTKIGLDYGRHDLKFKTAVESSTDEQVRFATTYAAIGLYLKAPVSQYVSFGVSLANLGESRFSGPFDAEAPYGTDLRLDVDAAHAIGDSAVDGILTASLSQQTFDFKRPILQNQDAAVALDTKLAVVGAGIRLNLVRGGAVYGVAEQTVWQANEGSARFAVLARDFTYTLANPQRLRLGLSLDTFNKVTIRFEKTWLSDDAWTVAADVSL